MHPLHLLFSVPVGLYSTAWRIFACRGEPPKKSRPPVVDLPVDAFGVRRYMRAILREDHVSHLEGSLHPCGKLCHERGWEGRQR